HDMNNMNANMNNAFIRANIRFIYSYSRSANMNMPYIRIHLFLSEPYAYTSVRVVCGLLTPRRSPWGVILW
ncbi:hypothetical protein VN97_g13073, partial [Penicillium thymicola]